MLIRILFLLGLAVAVFAITTVLRKRKQLKDNPYERIQTAINEETEKLHNAAQVLRASENFIRQLQREVEVRKVDINTLNAQIKKLASEDKDEQARIYISTLTHKETEMALADDKYQKAMKRHQASVEIVEAYRTSIKNLKQEASELQLRVNLAAAERDAAALGANVETHIDTSGYEKAKEELEDRIRKLTAEAEIDTRLIAKPGDEFLKAVPDADIEARLQQIKSQVKQS